MAASTCCGIAFRTQTWSSPSRSTTIRARIIDNQTWPAPHLQTYLKWLDAQVRRVTGPVVPTFINTYDMKVPASSPVWAMGNWYQSLDAYAIGAHDRLELDFASGTLTTQERAPFAASEFQAGWSNT